MTQYRHRFELQIPIEMIRNPVYNMLISVNTCA